MAKEKAKKKNNKFFKFIWIVLLLSTILFLGGLYYLDMVPMKYFSLIICATIVMLGLFGIFLLNIHIKKKIKVFFTLLSIIIIAVEIVVSNFTINTKDIINKVTQKINYKTENYSLIVLNDSSYEKIEDLKNKDVGYLDNGTKGTKKAIEKLEKEADTKEDSYDDVAKLSVDLLDEKIDGILIEDSFKAILEEHDENFIKETKVLHKFSVKVSEEKTSKKVDMTNESFNVYITGIDTYGKITSVSRSDVNIVATVNPKTGNVLLTSIPRDYYVELHGTNGQKDKLTHAGIYGVEKSVNTIEDLLDIKINYYVKVNFTSIVKLVDTIGGITVHSDYNFISKDNYKYVKGNNVLNGKKALSFARERNAFASGDLQRGKNQMYVIEGIADELMTFKSVTKFNSLLDTLDGTFETNVSSDEISKIVKMQIDKNIMWNIESNSLEGTGDSKVTYTTKSTKTYVMVPDSASVLSAQTKISKIMNNEE